MVPPACRSCDTAAIVRRVKASGAVSVRRELDKTFTVLLIKQALQKKVQLSVLSFTFLSG